MKFSIIREIRVTTKLLDDYGSHPNTIVPIWSGRIEGERIEYFLYPYIRSTNKIDEIIKNYKTSNSFGYLKYNWDQRRNKLKSDKMVKQRDRYRAQVFIILRKHYNYGAANKMLNDTKLKNASMFKILSELNSTYSNHEKA